MRFGQAFDDVLDERLKEYQPAERRSASAPRTGTAAAYGFFFAESAPLGLRSAGAGLRPVPGTATALLPDVRFAGAVSTGAVDCRSEAFVPSATCPDTLPRARRRLAVAERRALEDIVALGAGLSDEFTHAELRSAFRLLARRYHPDRHSGSSDRERLRLSRLFARVRDAYRLLVRVV